MVKLGKSQDKKKTLTKHAKTSQNSQSKFSVSFVSFHTGVQPYAPLVDGLVDDWCCIPDHAAIRRRFRSSALSCLIHSILYDTPNLVIHWKIHWQHMCQKLSKSAQDQQSYCKNKKGAVFFKHSVCRINSNSSRSRQAELFGKQWRMSLIIRQSTISNVVIPNNWIEFDVWITETVNECINEWMNEDCNGKKIHRKRRVFEQTLALTWSHTYIYISIITHNKMRNRKTKKTVFC